MKILVVTQIVDKNDDVLGFMHGWILEFAKQVEAVTVICLKKGECDMPNNVKVLSLGKELGSSRAKYLWNFYKYIWQERNNYYAVFVHMNSEYVLLAGLFWRFWNKKISLWYAHGYAPWHLKIAEGIVDTIFTSTSSGCRLDSNKIRIVGQGIDIEKFKGKSLRVKDNNERFEIISVGRISPVKDYETLIDAAQILKSNGLSFEIKVIGGVGLGEQDVYLNSLKNLILRNDLSDSVKFLGPIPNKDIVSYLNSSGLFINTSRTGSLDKAVLEAMATGLPIVTCNEALVGVLGEYAGRLMFKYGDAHELAKKIRTMMDMSTGERLLLGGSLRELVVKNHGLTGFIRKIVSVLNLQR